MQRPNHRKVVFKHPLMIFAKTNLGRIAAFDPQSTLTGSQKNLLRHIDGKTRLTTLNATLPPTACSIELIEALLDQELIQLAKTETGRVGPSANDDDEANPGRRRHLSLVPDRYDDTTPASLAALLEPERMADFADSSGHSADYRERLQTAKDSLVSFVLHYLPHEANAVLQEINQIAHNQQLKATIVAVLSMANQGNHADAATTRVLNQTLQALSDE